MSQTIKLKRSSVVGKVPSTGNLDLGEIALNTNDGKVFFKKNDGTDSIQTILTTDAEITGNLYLSGSLTASSALLGPLTFPTSDGSAGQFLKTDGAGNIGFVDGVSFPFTGSAIISSSLQVTGSFSVDGSTTTTTLSSSYIDLDVLVNGDVPSHKEGRIFYGADDGALSVYNDEADITLQVGQEFLVRVFNPDPTNPILNGTPVRISGSQGDRPRAFPATAEDHTDSLVFENHIIGVATHDIGTNSEGYVTAQGIVRGVNTSAFAAGDILYLQTGSPALPQDYYRNTPPSFPYDVVIAGLVARSATNGFIFVEPVEPVHFTNISGLSGSINVNDGALWVYESSSGAWINSNTLPNIEASGSFSGSFQGDGSGLTGVGGIFAVSGSDVDNNQFNDEVSVLQFDSSTGLNVSQSAVGTALVSIGSHYRDIIINGQTTLVATGSDQLEFISGDGIDLTTSMTDTNANSVSKEINFSVDDTVLRTTGDSVVSSSAQISHDSTSGFVSNEHIDHSGVSITAGNGLTGGGNITTSRTINVGAGDGITVNADDIEVDSTVARTNVDNNFSTQQTFTDIVVNGTGSFAVIESVTGSAKIIGDAYVVVNNNTPAERYAGIKVFDSGSAGVTASLEFDGETNDWFYEYSDDGGATTDHGVVIFGPEYSTKGSPTYLGNNLLQKGTGGHHLADSNITDTGTLITLGSNTSITGTLTATGTTIVSSSSQIATDISGAFVEPSSSFSTRVTTNETDISNLQTDSGSFSTRVSTNETDISNLQTDSGSFSTRVTTNESDISTNQSDISDLQTDSGSFSTRVSTNETDISNLQTDSGSFSTRVTSNESDISTNQTDISNLQTDSGSFSTRVSTNESDISNLQTDSGSFSTRVSTNETDISNLQTDSGSFSTRVSGNETDISNLQTDSGSFSTRVSTNESDISTLQSITFLSSSAEGDAQGQIKLNGVNVNTNGLGTDDSPQFTNLTLSGNLTVNGTTTTVNSTEVEIGDRIIVLNGQDAAGDSGINVYDTSTNQTGSLLWDTAGDYWKGGELGSEARFLTVDDEGSGNGLDADTVDSLEASQFLRSDANDTATGNIRIENANNLLLTITGSNASYTGTLIANSGTGAASLYFDSSNGDLTGNDYAVIEQTNDRHLKIEAFASAGDIILRENGAETMRLKDGNVGIGTNNPSIPLQVSKSEGANFIAALQNQANDGHGLYIQAGGTSGTRFITQWKDAAGTERFHMDDTGEAYFQNSVGIGIDGPTGNFNSYISDARQLTHNGNGGDLSIISDNNSTPVMYIKGTGTADLLNVFDNTTEVFTILDGGNVGVGTTSPTDKFDVFSSSNNQRLIRISHPSAPTQAAGFLGFNSDGTTDNNVVTLGVQYSSVYYNALNIQRSTRNVGIGTTNPESLLHAKGSSAGAGVVLKVENTGANGAAQLDLTNDAQSWFVNTRTDDKFSIYNNTAASTALTIDTSNKVGIGTIAPDYELDVAGNIGVNEYIYHNGDTNTYIRFQPDDISLVANGNNLFRVDGGVSGTPKEIVVNESGANTDFRVESDTVTNALFVTGSTGDVGIKGGADTSFALKVTGDFAATGEVTAYVSDERLKDIISPITEPIQKIQSLDGFYYLFNETAESIGIESGDKRHVGLSAQQVQKVLPEIVTFAPADRQDGKSKTGEDYLTIHYDKLVPLLVEGIKEQQQTIEKLQNEVKELQKVIRRA